mmetsp:Transcript_37087/g.85726  ORF Transcript_37087/g.85726 Transcript_37087/m.85726 type:complete len:376 (+) Transcript_37087:76-1203(+)
MARSGRVMVPALLCMGLIAFLSQGSVFVPAPQASNRLPATAIAVPALLAGAPAAFADAIGDAAAKFSDATYPIAEKINWGNTPIISSYFAAESARNPKGTAAAVDRLLEAGLTMDPKLIKDAVAAHAKALKSAQSNPNLVTSKEDFAAVNEALARMISSAKKDKFFALLDAFPGNKDLQMDLYNQNDKVQAQAAYQAFKELTSAVKEASINGANALAVTPETGGPIGDAAAKFSAATYPLAEKINWGNTQQIAKYISEVSANNPKGVADAFDKVLESGLTMDPKLIQAAVAAHDKALDGALSNPNLMASPADWAAVNEALARMIGSADPAKFKALLTAFPGNAELQMALFAANNPADAKAAYETFVALTKAVEGR